MGRCNFAAEFHLGVVENVTQAHPHNVMSRTISAPLGFQAESRSVPELPFHGESAMTSAHVKRTDREFIKFCAIGVAGLFVDVAALWTALHLIGLNLYAGRLFSYLIAATFTWACNRSLTFVSASADGAIRQWARFIFFNAIGGSINFLVYVLVAVKLPEHHAWSSQITSMLPYLGVFCGSISGLAFNFLTSKFLVFR